MTSSDEPKELCDAVDIFAEKMKKRLLEKLDEGFYGWDDVHYKDDIVKKLIHKTARLCNRDVNQGIDIANFAMMIDYMENNNDYTKED